MEFPPGANMNSVRAAACAPMSVIPSEFKTFVKAFLNSSLESNAPRGVLSTIPHPMSLAIDAATAPDGFPPTDPEYKIPFGLVDAAEKLLAMSARSASVVALLSREIVVSETPLITSHSM
jgi:hypothetical protein